MSRDTVSHESEGAVSEREDSVGRREMIKLTGGAAAIGLAGSNPVSAQQARGNLEQRLDDTTLIDDHVHIHPIESGAWEPFSAETAVDWMDANGLDQVALLPLESPTSWPYPVPSWWVLEEAQKYPDRFIPFGTVSARIAAQYGESRIVNRIRKYSEMGAQGLGEFKSSVPFNHEWAQVVYKTCGNLDLPVIFHIDGTNLTDEPGLPRTEEMLKSYPDTVFIGHGPGWWGEFGRGDAIPRLVNEYDNIYCDISAGSGWRALNEDYGFTQSFLNRHHDQVIFGTDKLSREQTVPHFDVFEEFNLPPHKWENIRFRNFQNLVR